MRLTIRNVHIGGLLAMALAVLSACGSDPLTCPRVEGLFEPLYVPVQTTCGTLASPNRVTIDGGRNGVNTIVVRRVNDEITTHIVMKGCTMRVTQVVTTKEGAVQSEIDGSSLSIENEEEVSGMVTVTQFDDAGNVSCSGLYDAKFSKNTAVVGGAAL